MSSGGQPLPEGSRVILRGYCGSTIHGTSVSGQDDRDELGVCVEPREYVIGLKHFETHVWRTQPEGVKSGPGDLDLTIHSLRKYVRLAAHGNPTIITLLFLPDEFVLECDPLGFRLVQHRQIMLSRKAGVSFLGYMTAQRERLEGTRGGRHGWRQALVEQYGFDTKYAGHLIRLGYQGVEFMRSGVITLPMPQPMRDYVVAIRTGEVSLKEVLLRAGDLESDLRYLIDAPDTTSPLPEQPDYDAIDRFLIEVYESVWRSSEKAS